MQAYTRKSINRLPEKKQRMEVVFDVMRRRHNFTCPLMNSANRRGRSPWLAQLERTTLSFTTSWTKESEAFSSKFACTTTLVSFLPKRNRNVTIMTSLHKTAEISDHDYKESAIILDHSHNKGIMDKKIGTLKLQEDDYLLESGHLP